MTNASFFFESLFCDRGVICFATAEAGEEGDEPEKFRKRIKYKMDRCVGGGWNYKMSVRDMPLDFSNSNFILNLVFQTTPRREDQNKTGENIEFLSLGRWPGPHESVHADSTDVTEEGLPLHVVSWDESKKTMQTKNCIFPLAQKCGMDEDGSRCGCGLWAWWTFSIAKIYLSLTQEAIGTLPKHHCKDQKVSHVVSVLRKKNRRWMFERRHPKNLQNIYEKLTDSALFIIHYLHQASF